MVNGKRLLILKGNSLTLRFLTRRAKGLMVHSHLRFSQLLPEPELIVEQWVTLYYMGAFTPAIWSAIAWTEKFNNGLCTHFLRLCGLKSSHNSSCLNNRRCELSLIHYTLKFFESTCTLGPVYNEHFDA